MFTRRGMTVTTTESIRHLNIILKNELTAINQYFMHSRMLEHMGLHSLAKKVYEESIDEMKHADTLIRRIFFLEGLPNLQDLNKLKIGETPKEMLEKDLELEDGAIADLRAARQYTDEINDVGSVTIIEDILNSEEEHQDWLRQQLNVIENVGIENYLQSQV